MPGHLVFPGGRLEPADVALARRLSVEAALVDRLMLGAPRLGSPHRAAALAFAAIRETQEETGLLVAERADGPPLPGAYAPFAAAGVVPSPRSLVPLARAITPPGLPRRFDARFFLAPAECLLERPDPIVPPSDEFDSVIWLRRSELKTYRTAQITERVLDEAFRRIDAGTAGDPTAPFPFFRRRGEDFVTEYL